MNIEIVAIGSEVLSGMTINSNAAFLSRELLKMGFRVSRHTSLPDEREALKQGLREAMLRSPLIIATGGLGPTLDDITRQVSAELFDSDFFYDESWALELEKRYQGSLRSIKDQATVPRKATLLPNPVGTAPGFIFKTDASALVLLPGVPHEMKEMWKTHMKPFVQKQMSQSTKKYARELHLFNLPESAVDPHLRELQETYPKLDYGIYTSYGILTVQFLGDAEEDLEAPFEKLAAHFSKYRFEAPHGRIEEAVQERFIKNGWTLSIAESCTGGNVAARLTRLPGASKYFLGSLVTYANRLKTELLQVPEELIQKHGAVSGPVAEAMVRGVLKATGSTYGLAVTGIAGPEGGTAEKPVGTIWGAFGNSDRIHVWTFRGYGTREMIFERAVNALLAEVLIQTAINSR